MTDENRDNQLPELGDDDEKWESVARDAYVNSTDYFDANIRHQIERNIALFRSKHPQGSKYYSEAYRHRSKVFRPKTRSSVRRAEAAAAVAFFSTADVVSVQATNPSHEIQQASAAVYNEVMNARLNGTIPWFLTCLGAYQDADVTGVCISKQYWNFKEQRTKRTAEALGAFGEKVIDIETGESKVIEVEEVKRVTDTPAIDLIPIENFRFSPSADWRDPVNSSPYVIHLVPMFIGDVQERMAQGKWLEHDIGEILAARRTDDYDSVRAAREGPRTDKTDITHKYNEFDVVWCHELIVRKDGEDWVYWTLGEDTLLTRPKPLREVYHHGVRPFTVGFTEIETHKAYPAGKPELGESLQIEANELSNQRVDNVRLILNQRYKVRRGSDVDLQMLKRSIPGGLVPMSNLADVEPMAIPDTTAGSYQEQDRLNADFDDLLGTFSTASVSTARNMNETVGGMQMLEGAANALTEMSIRVFAETWVQPVMRQLLLLEKTYEDDQTLLTLSGVKAKLALRFGMDEVTDEILAAELTTQVNVGFGSTNPQQRVERLAYALGTVSNFAPHLLQSLNGEEVIAEVFGALGHKDGARFFNLNPEDGPSKEQLMAQAQEMQAAMQEMQAQLQGKQAEVQGRLQQEQIRGQNRLQEVQMKTIADQELEHLKGRYKMEIEGLKAEIGAVDRMIQSKHLELDRGKLELQRVALEAQIRRAERELTEKVREFEVGRHERAAQPASNPIQGGPTGPGTDSLKGVIQRDNYGMIPDAVG